MGNPIKNEKERKRLIRLSTLPTLEDISDVYAFDPLTYQVINTEKNTVKKFREDSEGYPTVSLSRKYPPGSHSRNVRVHIIVALFKLTKAGKKYDPSKIVEHFDDDKSHFHLSNIGYSTQKDNYHSAVKNNRIALDESIFELCLADGSIHRGTLYELSMKLGITNKKLRKRLSSNNPLKTNSIRYIKQISEGEHHSSVPYGNKDTDGFMFLHWKRDIRNRLTD